MKTLLVVVILAVGFFSVAYSEQRYNPYENRWETTTPNAKIRYNPYDNTWQYVTPPPKQQEKSWYEQEPKPEYNPYNNRWEWPK